MKEKRGVELLQKVVTNHLNKPTNQPIIMEVKITKRCKECGSVQFMKYGTVTLKTGKYQRYKCCKCAMVSRDKTTIDEAKSTISLPRDLTTSDLGILESIDEAKLRINEEK